MANQPTKYKKFVATAATATLVAAAIGPVASAATTFPDVPADDQYLVAEAVELGLMNGYANGNFGYTDSVKRSQVVLVLGRLLEKAGVTADADYATDKAFSDVSSDELLKYGNIVKKSGVFTGYTDGTLKPNNNINRENLAAVLNNAAKAIAGVSLVELAAAIEDKEVSDLGSALSANRDAIQALRDLEISTVSTFNPKGDIQRRHFAKFAVTTIEVVEASLLTYDKVKELVEAAEKATPSLPSATSINKDNAAAAQTTVNQVQAVVDAATKALASTNKLTAAEKTELENRLKAEQAKIDAVKKAIEEANAPVLNVAVSSVKTLNATQVEVVFNTKVDKDTAQNINNYSFITLDDQPTAVKVDGAKLSDDERTVILTMTTAPLKRYQVKISDVASKTDANDKVTYNEIVTFAADTTAPTITGTERISATKVKVKFSEPVNAAAGAISAQYADGTAITSLNTTLNTKTLVNEKELIIDLADSSITLNKDIRVTFNGVADTGGNLLSPQPASVTVQKVAVDGVAPTVSTITQSGPKTFNIKFTKDLAGLTFTANGAEVAVEGTTVTAIEKVSASEYKVTVSTNLDGIRAVAVKAGKIVDLDNQANAQDVSRLVTFQADLTAPKATAKKVVGSDNKEYIELTFDKDIDLGTGAVSVAGSYVKDYVTTSVSAVTETAKFADASGVNKRVVLVPLTNASLAVENAAYNVSVTSTELKSLFGTAVAKTDASYTRGKDGQAAGSNSLVIDQLTVAQGSTPDTVEVVFSLPQGATGVEGASATNAANYAIAGAVVESVTLGAATPGNPGTQKAILKLKEDSNTFTGVRNIVVSNVKISGSTKVMNPYTVNTVSLKENVRPTVTSAAISSASTVTVTFSEAIGTVATDAFTFKIGTATYATTAAVNATTPSQVVLTLSDSKTFSSNDLTQTITVEPAKTQGGTVDTDKFKVSDTNGNALKEFAPVTVAKP